MIPLLLVGMFSANIYGVRFIHAEFNANFAFGIIMMTQNGKTAAFAGPYNY